MAGGGDFSGVSSTGLGQPSSSAPGLGGGNGLGLGMGAAGLGPGVDNFGGAPTQTAVMGQTPTAGLGQMRGLLRGNAQPTQPSYSDTISGYYHDLLHRDPDQAGLDFWSQQANSGVSLDDIKKGFLGSQEYLNLPSGAAYVNQVQNQQPIAQQPVAQQQVAQPQLQNPFRPPNVDSIPAAQPVAQPAIPMPPSNTGIAGLNQTSRQRRDARLESRGISKPSATNEAAAPVTTAPSAAPVAAAPAAIEPAQTTSAAQSPVFNNPFITQYGENGAFNAMYNRGGITSLMRRR